LNPVISIITPSYNKVDFIMQTVNAVIAQSYRNWEMIIIDDCSTDNSQHLLSNIETIDARIKAILNKKNTGGNACRNQGLAQAKGQFVIFLDADDILDNHCLASRIEQALNFPAADLWVFPMAIFKQKVGDINANQHWIPPHKGAHYLHFFLKHQLPWQTMQPLWKKEFLNRINGFDTHFIRLQDVELHTRALLENAQVETFPLLKKDCNFRIDENRFGNKVFNHLDAFSKGAVQYYNKFIVLSKGLETKKYLTGTLLETLSNVCYQYKLKKIKKQEYHQISKLLINTCVIAQHKKLLQSFAFIYSISPLHPKGLKKTVAILAGIHK
jgi:glycosyltransferase involved in cell wall biosynthesis